MQIVKCEKIVSPIFYVETDETECNEYRRLCKDVWEKNYGMEWITVHDSDKLEELFAKQNAISDHWIYNSEPKAPCLVKLYDDFVFCINKKQVDICASCYEITAWLHIILPHNHKIEQTTCDTPRL